MDAKDAEPERRGEAKNGQKAMGVNISTPHNCAPLNPLLAQR